MTPGRYAAIDIGTVSTRMLVADVDAHGHLEIVERDCRVTDLGEGTAASGELSQAAMDRTAAVVADYLAAIGRLRTAGAPIPLRVVATSAARDARNADEFAARLAALGVTLSVIPGTREAALSFKGASLDHVGEHVTLVDIGGGSTEFIDGIGGADPDFARSIDMGCRRLTETCGFSDPPTPEQLAHAREVATAAFRPVAEALSGGFGKLVCVAGSPTSVVAVHLGLEPYDSSRVHGFVLTRAVLDQVARDMSTKTLAELSQVPGLSPKRDRVFMAGCALLQAAFDAAEADSCVVSESDILQGLVVDQANA